MCGITDERALVGYFRIYITDYIMDEIKNIIIMGPQGQKVYGIEDSEAREELANVVDGAPEELDSFKEAFEKFREGGEVLESVESELLNRLQGVSENSNASTDPFRYLGNLSKTKFFETIDALNGDSVASREECAGHFRATVGHRIVDVYSEQIGWENNVWVQRMVCPMQLFNEVAQKENVYTKTGVDKDGNTVYYKYRTHTYTQNFGTLTGASTNQNTVKTYTRTCNKGVWGDWEDVGNKYINSPNYGKKIAFFGGSFAQNMSLTSTPWSFDYQGRTYSLMQYIAEKLGATSFDDYAVGSQGVIVGDIPIMEQLQTAGAGYDIYVIFGGINDFGKEISLGESNGAADDTTYCGGLKAAFDWIRSNNKSAKIYTVTPFKAYEPDDRYWNPRSNIKKKGHTFYEFIQAQKEVAQIHGVPCFDLWANQQFSGASASEHYYTDLLHPNGKGYLAVADALVEFLAYGLGSGVLDAYAVLPNATTKNAGFMSAEDKEKFDTLIINDLTTGGANKALSAEMGKTIANRINNIKPVVINNAADEEDITSEDNLLKLKDRTGSNGMGYIILRKGKPFKEQLIQSNTIYEIRYDFDLGGETVEIPENCVLRFEGGCLRNGTLIGVSTKVNNPSDKNVFNNVAFKGDFKIKEVHAEWFGDLVTSEVMNEAVNVAHTLRTPLVLLPKIYEFNSPIYIKGQSVIKGTNQERVYGDTESEIKTLVKFTGSHGFIIETSGWGLTISDMVIQFSDDNIVYDAITNENNAISVHLGKIKRVTFLNACHAINIKLFEDQLFKFEFSDNIIYNALYGIMINGNGYNGTWSNNCLIENNRFTKIRMSAIYVHTELNLYNWYIERNVFEYIGKNYIYDEYKKNGYSVIRLRCNNKYNHSMNYVDKNIFELCTPKRDKDGDINVDEVELDTETVIINPEILIADINSASIVIDGYISIAIRDNNLNALYPLRSNAHGDIIVTDNNIQSFGNINFGQYKKAPLVLHSINTIESYRTYLCKIRHSNIVTTENQLLCPISNYLSNYTYDVKTNLPYNANSEDREIYISAEGAGNGTNPNDCASINNLPLFYIPKIKILIVGDVNVTSYTFKYINCDILTYESYNNGVMLCDTILRMPNVQIVNFHNITMGIGSTYWMIQFEDTSKLKQIHIKNTNFTKSSQCIFNITQRYNIVYMEVDNITTMNKTSLLRGDTASFVDVECIGEYDNLVIYDRHIRPEDGVMKNGEHYICSTDGSFKYMINGEVKTLSPT